MSVKQNLALVIVWVLLGAAGGALSLLAGAHLYLSPSLPSVESLRDFRLETPLRIYSKDGKLIGEIGEQRRTPVKFEEIPKGYIDALLAAEDAQFYQHNGVSIRGLMRAATQLVSTGSIQGGGSTITMQVARNYFLTLKQEFKRKFNEILLALRIERELSKEEILELYVNIIFLGHRAYGIEAAAQIYYGRPLARLSTAELAMLAGLPKAPSTINPITNPERAITRRNWILGRMHELGMLSQADYSAAVAEPVTASLHGTKMELNAAYVAEMARQRAVEMFGRGAYTDGYRVYTTIDSKLQAVAQKAVVDGLVIYDTRHGYRGPEATLPVPPALAAGLSAPPPPPSEAAEPAADTAAPFTFDPDAPELAAWRAALVEALQAVPVYGGLLPAAIMAVGHTEAFALTAANQVVNIGWEQGLSEAKPYQDINQVGPAPERAAEVVAPGHVVRLQRRADGYYLTELPAAQAALVSLNPVNGAVVALVGGLDFEQSNFNRAIQARRQPGSNFKPFVYTSALENGYNPASIINDAPIVFDDSQMITAWRPENDSGKFYGPTRLRKALYLSRNLVSIRLLRAVGIDRVLTGLERFGFDTDSMPRDLSLALGSHSTTPLEIAAGYAVLANGGYAVKPYFIDRILDFNGEVVFESLPDTACLGCDDALLSSAFAPPAPEDTDWPFLYQGDPFELSRKVKAATGTLEPEDYPRAQQVVEPQVAYMMDSMLKDVVSRGTATRAKVLERGDLAGKTGTTNNATDAWFSGYGGGLVTTTWVGFDQVQTLGRREYGGTAALPIWIDFMQVALAGRPEVQLPRPPGLTTVRIDPDTGLRAAPGAQNAIYELFREAEVPAPGTEAAIPGGWEGETDSAVEGLF